MYVSKTLSRANDIPFQVTARRWILIFTIVVLFGITYFKSLPHITVLFSEPVWFKQTEDGYLVKGMCSTMNVSPF